MNNIHKSWNKLFQQYDIDLDEIYTIGEVYPPKELVFTLLKI